MAKTKETTIEEREIIVKLFREEKTEREIAKIVERPRSTINSIVKRFRETGSVMNKARSGRPPKVTEQLNRVIIREVKKNPRISAPNIASIISESQNAQLNPQTIRNTLKKAGYNGRNARKKGLVSKANKTKRLNFAIHHANKPQSFWNKILWSDESKFELFSTKRKVIVWRKPRTEMDPKNLVPTVKHGGGSVMIWGCMAASGAGKLVFIDGRMDQFVYRNILEQNLMESARQLNIESDFVFQHDNDPKHTARSVKEWLSLNIPNVLEWPAQSPDINPIEHLWDHMDRQIRKMSISNLNQLKSAIVNEWAKIPPAVTRKLVESMPRRLQAVRNAKGNPTKY